ncbi:hypothetical protein RHGRI_031431 [Rhododendron griersonianum]|uniref:Uncharacterized protein n=1 Tax=Rhododendron griersonianum TaxID=479676 RepID=A0AAV6I7X4_9ERIC|nr:hypothetical protein RHGRI_031431 [Rhododendron griersonianum]
MEALTLFTKKFKRSFKKDTNITLATKLKQCEKEKFDVLHELDVLKRKHINLENDMHSLFETNELLESKVAKLQVELDKANATFKKLNAGSQILDEVLSSQKMASDRGGLGYKAEGSSKSKAREKMIFCKPNSSAPASLVANKAKSPVKEKKVNYAHTKLLKVKKQCPAVKIATTKRGEGHIRPNCFQLHGYPDTLLQYQHVSKNGGKYHRFGYGFNRTKWPRHMMTSHEKNMYVNPNHLCKTVEKAEKVKTRYIWMRKSDLRPYTNFINALDDIGSPGDVDFAF